jgi:hypothetical protein
VEEFDEIWLLHYTIVWKDDFRLLSLLLCFHVLISSGTVCSAIALYGNIYLDLLRVKNSFVPVLIDDVLLLELV